MKNKDWGGEREEKVGKEGREGGRNWEKRGNSGHAVLGPHNRLLRLCGPCKLGRQMFAVLALPETVLGVVFLTDCPRRSGSSTPHLPAPTPGRRRRKPGDQIHPSPSLRPPLALFLAKLGTET